MYKNGKLTTSAREKLEKRYAKERAKDSILKKIDSKKRRVKKKVRTVNKKLEESKKIISEPKECVEAKLEEQVPVADSTISDCPDTPPRNEKIMERKRIMEANKGVNWISLTKFVEGTSKAEAELYEKLSHGSILDAKKTLEEQIRIKEELRDHQLAEKLSFQAEMKKMYAQWETEDSKKHLIQQKKVDELKQMRMEQIEDLKQRRDKFRQKELRRDRRAMVKVNAERKQFEQERVDRKKKTLEEMSVVLEENAKQKQVQLEMKRKEAEEDIRLQKQYAEMLKKQEEARSARLAKTYAQNEKKAANLLSNTAEERRLEAEAEARQEEFLRRQLEERDVQEQLKQERRRKEGLQIQEFLKNQIQARENALRKEIEEDRKIGAEMSSAALKSLEDEEELKQKGKDKLFQQGDFIKKQIEENKIRRFEDLADMTKEEKLFNKSLIQAVEKGIDVKEPKFNPKNPFSWRYNYRGKPF